MMGLNRFFNLWQGFQDKDLRLPGYFTREANCLYLKKNENRVLIVTSSKVVTTEQIVQFYQLQAAWIVGLGSYLRRENIPFDQRLSPLEENLNSSFNETTLLEIATGAYDRLLYQTASRLERSGEQINLRYGVIPEDIDRRLALINNNDNTVPNCYGRRALDCYGRTVLDCYDQELHESWSANLPLNNNRPAKLKEVLRELSSGNLDPNIITIGGGRFPLGDTERYVSPERIREVITALYQGGLYWRSHKIPDRTDLALEMAAYELHLDLQLDELKNDPRQLWCSGSDLALDLAFNGVSN